MAGTKDKRNYIPKEYPRLETLQVKVPTCFLRMAPKPSGAAGTELIFGERFYIHKRDGHWAWGRSENALPGKAYPGYVGWVRKSNLSDETDAPNYKVTVLSAPVFSKRSIKSNVKHCLPLNSIMTGRVDGGFIKTAAGYLHARHVAKIDVSNWNWVDVAENLIGRPYIWGGVSSFGLDCSGLVQTALRAAGRDAPRDSDQQTEIGEAVGIAEPNLKRGDLVFWKGHVGIMQSADHILHANAFHMAVASEPLKAAVQRIKENAGPITAIRRLNF